MTDKERDKERNYVAEAQNWEARVRGELDSARVSSVRAIVHVGRTCVQCVILHPILNLLTTPFFRFIVVLGSQLGRAIP